MAKYVFPAVFTLEKNGQYSINFPDIEGCYTCGENIEDALMMAEDVLAFTLYDYEKEGLEIPQPSLRTDIVINSNEFINYVLCDTIEYRKMHNNKAVKKTLTIPEWINETASAMGLNFSQILQEALLDRISTKQK